jgi:opacity protein-like surface antigen
MLIAAILATIAIGGREASAQNANSIGVNVGYNLEAEELFAGGQARFALPAFPVMINPSLETYFIEDVTWLQIDLNVLYPFGTNNTTFTPYAGAGLGVNYVKPENLDSRTDAGLNFIAGANFGFGRLQPFAEARINLDDGTNVGLRGGLLIGI